MQIATFDNTTEQHHAVSLMIDDFSVVQETGGGKK